MEWNAFEKAELFPELAFFAEDTSFLAHELRPVSLCSYKAMEWMGLDLLNPAAEMTLEEETRQIASFLWLHGQPVPAVCRGLWRGTWRIIPESISAGAPEVVNEFRVWRTRLIGIIESVNVAIRPQPRSSADKTPRDVIGPNRFAFTLGMIANYTRLPVDHIKWHMFIGEALQHYHTALRRAGFWTVRPGREIVEEDFTDLRPDWMKEPPPIGPIDSPSATDA